MSSWGWGNTIFEITIFTWVFKYEVQKLSFFFFIFFWIHCFFWKSQKRFTYAKLKKVGVMFFFVFLTRGEFAKATLFECPNFEFMYMSKKNEPSIWWNRIWCNRIWCNRIWWNRIWWNRIWYFRNSSIFYLRNSFTFLYSCETILVYECKYPRCFVPPDFFRVFFLHFFEYMIYFFFIWEGEGVVQWGTRVGIPSGTHTGYTRTSAV